MKDVILLVLAFLLSTPLQAVICSGKDVWISNVCLIPNIDTEYCATLSACVDTTNGDCFNSKCVCNNGYKWTYYHNKCLKPNDGSSNCDSIDDCMEQLPSIGNCNGHKCRCISATWSSPYVRCLIPNNDPTTPCGNSADCYDNDNGQCNGGRCKCKNNYGWVIDQSICRAYNEGSGSCQALSECYDNSNRGLCDGKCKCNTDCVNDPTLHWCKAPNTGVYSCDSITQCIDSSSMGLCSGTCQCIGGGVWSTSLTKCLIPNDDSVACTGISQCADQSAFGECITNCKCVSGSIWVSSYSKCSVPNDGTAPCISVSTCQDSSSRATCNVFCKCLPQYLWSFTYGKCLIPNDGTTGCSVKEDCIDSNGLCSASNKCLCPSDSAWISSSNKCKCKSGWYSATGFPPCTECEQGKYQNLIGQISCLNCPSGTYNPATGSTGISDCLLCPQGTYGLLPAAISCINCGVGTYNNLQGKTLFTDCNPCPINTYSASSGQALCSNCPAYSEGPAGSSALANCLCIFGYYHDLLLPDEYCLVCYSLCTACSGSALSCSSCVSNPGVTLGSITVAGIPVTSCVCQTNLNYYTQTNPSTGKDECLPCHNLCLTCSGGSKSQCYSCKTAVDVPNIGTKIGTTCDCTLGWFYDSNFLNPIDFCQPCDSFCVSCEFDSDVCSECKSLPGIIKANNKCLCSAPGYFQYTDANINYKNCSLCHKLCLNCTGSSASECSVCNSDIGGILIAPNTCGCHPHLYYDEVIGKCMPCNYLCGDCFGPESTQCLTCNTTTSYSVSNVQYLCVNSCDSLSSYYRNGSISQPCDNICETCYGPNSTNCIFCKDPLEVSYFGSCVPSCPSHYFESNRICYACDSSCEECINASSFGCLGCELGKFLLWQHRCVASCPDKTYVHGIVCEDCISPCETCTSSTTCIKCLPEFMLNSVTKRCENNCPSGTYADQALRTCFPCNIACHTCSNPTSQNCLTCNYLKGYGRSQDNDMECKLVFCTDGMYINFDNARERVDCNDCHISCKTCAGPNREDCITCKNGFRGYSSPKPNKVTCISCKELHPGYVTEICGDGYNLGQMECDDGNNVDGDGCSSDCRIEVGYNCLPQPDQPDICADISPPTAKIKIRKENILIITFDETVTAKVDSADLISSMNVTLEGRNEPCSLSWSLNETVIKDQSLNQLVINVKPKCSLQLGAQIFVVNFEHPEYLVDSGNNNLATTYLTVRTLRFVYISDVEKAVLESSGTAFSMTSVLTLGLVIGANLFQSAAVGSFWAFVNMLQMLSFMPIINCVIPYNFEAFLMKYLTVSKVAIPFNLLPSFFPNFLSFLDDFVTQPLNERFENCGFETLSFISNFGEELVTWFILLIFYLILLLITSIIPKTKCNTVHEWREDYEFNAVLRVLIECFLNMTFSAFLNIWKLDKDSKIHKISLAGACIAGYLSIGFVVVSCKLVEYPKEVLESKEFTKQYGTIVEEINLEDILCTYYYPIYLIRRFLYVIVLIVLQDFPALQLSLTIILLIFPIMFYLFIFKPFDNTTNNAINIYNEFILAAAFIVVLGLNASTPSERTMDSLGWVLIVLIIISLIISWVIMIPPMITSLIKAATNCCSKKGEEEEEEENSKEKDKDKSQIKVKVKGKDKDKSSFSHTLPPVCDSKDSNIQMIPDEKLNEGTKRTVRMIRKPISKSSENCKTERERSSRNEPSGNETLTITTSNEKKVLNSTFFNRRNNKK